MKSGDALRVLADVTGSQWGMVTSAQASALGVTRLNLSRLTEAGHLERLAHGVYKDVGAPGDEFEDLRAAWLSTDPKVLAENRMQDLTGGIVVASSSAAALHEISDLWSDRHEFVSAVRRQSQRSEIRYRQRALDPSDVTLVRGLPTMTIERTIADLVAEVGDISLVADVLGRAARKRPLQLDRLRDLLAPLAERNGFKRSDGQGMLDRLLEQAGLDRDSLAAGIAAYPQLAARVVGNYLAELDLSPLEDALSTPVAQQAMSSAVRSLAQYLETAPVPGPEAVTVDLSHALAKLVAIGLLDEMSRPVAGEALASALAIAPADREGAVGAPNLCEGPRSLSSTGR
ncbi:type IV toxin-antitoxin system AbiEi family antitoxin domain-containing protein [Zhihengliuella halotolerans]|nr:type IV toxin-antitoxin system AbiEi family antitoxin domain-containing protein [Zhihengliuella halotolerans]